MPPAPPHRNESSIIFRFFASLTGRNQKNASPRIDRDTQKNLNAPAKLFVWQPDQAEEEGIVYETLREALQQIPDDPDNRAFIITESGKILRPVQIQKLRQLLDQPD